MSKTRRIIYTLVLNVLLIIVVVGFSNHRAMASSTTAPSYTFKINAQKIADGAEYETKSANTQVSVVDSNGEVPTTVQWDSTEKGVATVDESGDTVNITRKGPGFTTIKANITRSGVKYSISFVLKIGLEINYPLTNAKTYISTTDKLPSLSLDTVSNTSQQIHLKYTDESVSVSGSAINISLATFRSNNPGVVTVDNQGKITVVGAGSTTITITGATMSSKNDTMSIDLTVVVAPTFSFSYKDSSGIDKTCNSKPDTSDGSAIYTGVPPNFTLASNAAKADNLTWKIYNLVGGKSTLVTSSETGLMTYSVSAVSGNVTFSKIKAGTYEIYAFDDKSYNTSNGAPYAYMKIYVMPNVSTLNIVMNVNDTYNILENTNLTNADAFNVINTYDTKFALLDQTTETITAKRQGEVTIVLAYNTGQKLFEGVTDVLNITINVTVVDGIALSTTNATIYTKGTLKLEQIVTNIAQVYWKSDDTGIADVEDGLVTGVKAGTTTITAWQNINGVVKKATCLITVQQSVSTITIDPSTKTLSLKEYLTVHATINPSGLKNITIHWKSSNDKVVAISEMNGLTATVQGLSGGHAVVSAINQDNVVVGYCDITVQQPVASIALSETAATVNLSLKQLQLRATVSPDNAINKNIVWSSTDTSKATVNASGLVTLVKPGTVTIVATSQDNPAAVAYCNLTIQIPVVSIALDETTKTMFVGDSARLSYVVMPSNASNSVVSWTSTNTAVATVDAAGKVSAKGVGTTVIILRTADGGFASYCTITVKLVATSVKFDVTELALKTSEYYVIKTTLTPKGSTDNDLVWTSSDTKVATVDTEGKVVAKSSGTAIIMAKTEAGGVAYCKITVTQAVTGLVLNYSEKTIFKGEKITLEASISPSTASKLDVTWKSSNPKVATVNNKGEVTSLIGGVVIITCTTADGGYAATCVLTVKETVTKITLNYDTYNLGLKKTVKLVATVTNETATNQKVTWSSSNKKVATVSASGKVIGIKAGYATITATAQDGSEVDASCEIRVVTLVTSVSLNRSTMSMFVGESKKIKASLKPTKATIKKVKWTSSDETIAIVDDDGMVIGVKAGSVMVTAEALDSSGKKAICYVTVYNRVASTGVTLQDKSLIMVRGESKIVSMVLNPTASTDAVKWSSENSAVASVDKKTGKIKANAPGTAYITVMTDSGKTATVEVTVIGLNETKMSTEEYTTYKQALSVEGASSAVTWRSSNPLVAIVSSDGTISTRAVGTTTITATVNGRKLSCKITVKSM